MSTAQRSQTAATRQQSLADQMLDPCFSNLDKILGDDGSIEAAQELVLAKTNSISS